MTQDNQDINPKLLEHLESSTWDPYRQQQISPSVQSRLVFDLQQRVRRNNMWQLTNKSIRATVWVSVLLLFATATWAFMNQNEPAVVDNLVNSALAQPGKASQEGTPDPTLIGIGSVVDPQKVLRFGEDIYISNYAISINKLNGETHLNFYLYWDSARDVTGQLNLFVHLIGQDGSVVAAHDAPIFVSDDSPPPFWTEGQIMEQFFHFAVGAEAAAAEPYQLFFGLYDTSTGNRLPISYFDQPQPDHQLLLTQVRIDDDQELLLTPNDDGIITAKLYAAETHERIVMSMPETDLLLLSNENGTAIVTFQFADLGQFVPYQWRYHPAHGGVESTGEGTLREIHSAMAEGSSTGVDNNNVQLINIADMSIKWSHHSEQAGWFYYNPQLLNVQAVSGEFNTYDLSSAIP